MPTPESTVENEVAALRRMGERAKAAANLLTPADAAWPSPPPEPPAPPPVIHRLPPRRSPSLLTTFVLGLLVGSWLGGGDEC